MADTTLTNASAKYPRAVLGSIFLGIGFALGLLVGVGMLVGAWLTMSPSLSSARPRINLPETALHASATDSGETFSIATGSIADGVEGIFCLDFLTGELQCWVLDDRRNQIGGYFKHNVVPDLGVDQTRKNPKYLMATGSMGFRAGVGGRGYSECILYVADAKSGNVVGYVVPWNKSAASRGAQGGIMIKVFQQAARHLEIRGQ